MGIQDRQLDFEDFSSDTEKLSAILKRCEVSSQKHKLCYEYYRSRKFALLHPSVIACIAIGILGFVVTTDAIKRHMKLGDVQVEDILTLVVGFLGFFVGMTTLLMNQWDFGSRESMHLSAIVELESLGDRIRFWKMDRQVGTGPYDENIEAQENMKDSGRFDETERKALGVVEAPKSHKVALVVASGNALKKVEGEIKAKTVQAKKTEDKRSDVSRFSGYNGAYHQINRSCKSEMPAKLSRPFDLFESRLECMSLGHLGVIWDTRMRRNQIMRLAAVEIYNEITGYWMWPFGTPDIESVIDRSMKRVARLISKDYRAPIKVRCCGFTIFRCCCRKSNPKVNLLHNIVSGMEHQERNMMHSREAANYKDARERDTQNLLEDEAYEAEKKLQYLEDETVDYNNENNHGSYYSEDYSREGSSRDQQTVFTEDGDSYARAIAAGAYDASRQGDGYSRSRGARGGYSMEETLTRSEHEWDEASESQYDK